MTDCNWCLRCYSKIYVIISVYLLQSWFIRRKYGPPVDYNRPVEELGGRQTLFSFGRQHASCLA